MNPIKEKILATLAYFKRLPLDLFIRTRESVSGNKTVIVTALMMAMVFAPVVKAWIESNSQVAVILTLVASLYLRIYTRTPITQSEERGD